MRKVISKDGTTIAFDRSGEGLPIILVGGALSNRTAAAPLAALLAPHWRVRPTARPRRCSLPCWRSSSPAAEFKR